MAWAIFDRGQRLRAIGEAYIARAWTTRDEARRERSELLRGFPPNHEWRKRLYVRDVEGVTRKPQGNKSNARRYEHEGRSLTLTEWSRETGIYAATIMNRLASGWTLADALTVPARTRKQAA
jgi:hypothetical protein